jgi:hypothetical protein
MCWHKWEERSAIFTSPYDGGFKLSGFVGDTPERMMFGFTTILLQCKKCGNLKEEVFYGDQRLTK